jgi:hypothetical protein
MRPYLLALAATLAWLAPAHAVFIHYQWDSRQPASPLFGGFTVDADKLADGPGGSKLLTFEAIVRSDFQWFTRDVPVFRAFPRVSFTLNAADPVPIDPVTGAILGSGRLSFGMSSVDIIDRVFLGPFGPQPVSPPVYYWLESGSITFRSGSGLQGFTGRDVWWPTPWTPGFGSNTGVWVVSVHDTPPGATPCPPALAMLLTGAGLLALRRWAGRRRMV